jgi:hypothetical protein
MESPQGPVLLRSAGKQSAAFMPSPLLAEVQAALALPSFPFHLHARGSEGLIWDSRQQGIVERALSGLRSLPRLDQLQVDAVALEQQVALARLQADEVQEPAIFGGYLLRHFGHFCHESLARLWWLGAGDPQHPQSREICRYLQAQPGDVYFFMPPWLDQGKELLPYMKQILEGLGLDQRRIRVIVKPVIFRKLLVPAQAWGFDIPTATLDQQLRCDSRSLMRSLFAGFHDGPSALPAPLPERPSPAPKVYVTRTGLPASMGRPIGDTWLDEVLKDAGYLIFSPEQHSIEHQVRVFAEASELVFIDGSAMYLLWFAKLRPHARITMILRRRQGRWMGNKVRELLAASPPIRWRTIDAVLAEDLTSGNDWQSQNLLDLGLIARQLLAPRPVRPSATAEQALARDLNTLATQLEPETIARVLQALWRKALVPDQNNGGSILGGLRWRLQRLLGARS